MVGILEAFVVERESFDDVFPQTLGRSDPEARRDVALHPITDRDDHVEVVMRESPLDGAAALISNY